MTDMTKTLRIFVSSPGDVGEERLLTHRVIKRLQSEFSGKVNLEGVFWEQEPLLATADFQTQLPSAAKADIAVFVLWSRLGTPLPSEHLTRPDGSRYNSGTEYEFEDAVKAFSRSGSPNILVYRKTTDPVTPLKTKEEVLARLAQKDALDAFIEKWFRGSDGSFTAAFHPYISTAQFEDLIEDHLRKLVQQSLAQEGPDRQSRPQSFWDGSPFRGLEVFEFDHAPIFFGRTHAVGDILNTLRSQAARSKPFVLVTGMSGVGKSSVVRAGVLPSLTQPGIIEGVGLWRYAIMRPAESTGDLFDGLANALFREEALPGLSSALKPAEFSDLLRHAPASAIPLIKLALAQSAKDLQERRQLKEAPAARLALIIDQLEELFTLQKVTPDQRRQFAAVLSALLANGQIWIIATLRSDFYHRCAELPELQDLKEGNGTYDLKPPSPAEILQMIRQPARIAGLRFEEDNETGARLDDAIYNAVIGSTGALPLLEFTLQELFNLCGQQGTLTFAAYRSLGGVEGSLAKRAETVFSSLPSEIREQLPTVLAAVVEFGHIDKKTPVRRYQPLSSFQNNPNAQALIDAFVGARLFITDRADDGKAVVSVAHEALLQHWPRLVEWVVRNTELLFQRTTLAELSQRWQDADKNPDIVLEKGKPLDDAEALLERTATTLTETEKSFVKASTRKRRSQGKYAWLGGLICWAVMVGISTKSNLRVTEGLSTLEVIYSNGLMILFALLMVAPVAWSTLLRWRAMTLTQELRNGRIFWTICSLFYAVIFYLASTIYSSPGTEISTYLGYLLILAVLLYLTGEKWLQHSRRKRQLMVMGSTGPESMGFRIPVRELAFLLLFLAMGVFFLLNETQNSENLRIELYRNLVHNSNGPIGIGPLTSGPDMPYIYYQFKKDSAGRTVRVEQIGIPAICVMPDVANYQNLPQTLGHEAVACVFNYGYDADGTLRSETAYNKAGQQVWTLQFTLPGQAYLLLPNLKTLVLAFKKGPAGTDETIDQVDLERAFEGLTPNQTVSRHVLSHDPLGLVTSIQTTDSTGRPLPDQENPQAKTEFSHNALGLVTEIRYFSSSGQLILNKKGYAVETVTYDPRGNMTGAGFLDVNRNPIKNADGYASAIVDYDVNGKLAQITMLDETGNPVNLANGVHRWTFDYDTNGNLVKQSVWDTQGNPAHTVVTVTGVCCEAEKLGIHVGDIITRYDGQDVVNHFLLDRRMRQVGLSKRSLVIKRNGQELAFQVSPGLIGIYFWIKDTQD